MKKEVLKHVLTDMKAKEIPLTKINIQKTLFFLKEIDMPITYRFELYLYGPFSFELKDDLNDMETSKELKYVNKMEYEITNKMKKEPIDNSILKEISNKIDSFKKAVGNKFSFENMEIAGTIIYCINALKAINREANEENVLKQFKIWKGKKYSKANKIKEIKEAFHKIQPLMA